MTIADFYSALTRPPSLYDIAYDLNAWGQNYPAVIGRLQSMGAVAVQKSKWWVQSHHTATELRDQLLPLMDGNDSLMVAALTGDVAGYEQREDLRNWMNAALARRAA